MKMIRKIIILAIISLCMNGIFLNGIVYGKVSLSTDISGFKAEISDNTVKKSASLKSIVGRFLGFLRVISAFVLVIILGTTGYKYIVATPEIKEDIQRRMFPIIFGIIFVFAASAIAGFILKGIGG